MPKNALKLLATFVRPLLGAVAFVTAASWMSALCIPPVRDGTLPVTSCAQLDRSDVFRQVVVYERISVERVLCRLQAQATHFAQANHGRIFESAYVMDCRTIVPRWCAAEAERTVFARTSAVCVFDGRGWPWIAFSSSWEECLRDGATEVTWGGVPTGDYRPADFFQEIRGGFDAGTYATAAELVWTGRDGQEYVRRMLPWRICWRGFLADVALFAAAWQLLSFALGKVHRTRRHARGRCPRCGYDLHGSTTAKCPECGVEKKT